MKESELLEDRKLRDKCVGRYEVLDKVKEVLLLPGFNFMTTQQVANYYEVTEEAIRSIIFRNRDELDDDGLKVLSGNEIKKDLVSFNSKLTNERGYFAVGDVKFAYRGNTLFPRRAILRVGMLLRDSEVAKEVRTQLLNIEEKASQETKTMDINEEQKLMLEVGMAVASGDANAVAIASTNLIAFKNRHIDKLKNDNKALAGEILKWADRNKLNAGIRKLAAVTGTDFGQMWNNLFKNLQYKYSINLKARGNGKKPYIQHIDETEWVYVMKSFCALCEAYNQSPTDMFQQQATISN